MTWAQSIDLEKLAIFAEGTRVTKARLDGHLSRSARTFRRERFESCTADVQRSSRRKKKG